MNPYLKEGLVGIGVFVTTLIVSAVATMAIGPNTTIGYGVSAVVMFAVTFVLARALGVHSFNDGIFRGSVWLMVSMLGFIGMVVAGNNADLLGETMVFVMLASLAGGPMLAGRLAEYAA